MSRGSGTFLTGMFRCCAMPMRPPFHGRTGRSSGARGNPTFVFSAGTGRRPAVRGRLLRGAYVSAGEACPAAWGSGHVPEYPFRKRAGTSLRAGKAGRPCRIGAAGAGHRASSCRGRCRCVFSLVHLPMRRGSSGAVPAHAVRSVFSHVPGERYPQCCPGKEDTVFLHTPGERIIFGIMITDDRGGACAGERARRFAQAPVPCRRGRFDREAFPVS